MLKYKDVDVVFKEVPDEISLAFSISNCPIKCPQCHSPELQTDVGEPLTNEVIDEQLKKNESVTCVLFLGHGDNFHEIIPLLKHCKDKGLKTCLYTGVHNKSVPNELNQNLLDYIKTGPYINKLGGLNSKTTNQRFYKVTYLKDIGTSLWEDYTEKFWL